MSNTITNHTVLDELELAADEAVKKATSYERKTHAQMVSLLVKVVKNQQFLIDGLKSEIRSLTDGPQ